jgi:RNA polymerase primary sigma factor
VLVALASAGGQCKCAVAARALARGTSGHNTVHRRMRTQRARVTLAEMRLSSSQGDQERDERKLVLAARSGSGRERAEFVDVFLPQIGHVAREYHSVRAVSREELMQAGVVGLLRALERYDPTRTNRFWTYARWWVRHSMQELVSSLGGVVVLSDRALRQLARVNAARSHQLQSRGREPSTRDLAAVTGLGPAHVSMLVGAAQAPQALDERADGDDPWRGPLVDSLPDPAGEDGYEHATLRVAAHALPAVLATLAPRELAIVRGRYGIDGEQRSLRDLAAELRMSVERVRQIEELAMDKLRESCDTTVAAV